MRKLTLFIISLLCYVGVLHAEALVADGVYTLSADVNKQRGELVAANDYNYPVLEGIDLNGYTQNSTDAMTNGQYWYVRSVDASSNIYYIYNIAKGKYLVNDNGDVDFGDTPYEWTFVTNASKQAYLNIKDAKKTGDNKVWLSSGCGRNASQRPVQWDSNNNDGGALYTFTRISDYFATPETGKFYKIKGTHSTNPWLTATVEGGGIDVAENEDAAAVYLKTAKGLKAISTGKYIGTGGNGEQISLVDEEAEVTIEKANACWVYIKTGGRYLYNNQPDYTREAGNKTATGNEEHPKWGFIEVEAPAATVDGVLYETLADALEATETMTGDVTVEIYEKVTLNGPLTGSYSSINFVGKAENAEIYIDVQGYVDATGEKVAFENLKLSKVAGPYMDNAGFRNLAFGVYGVTEATYTNCTFVNGAYASEGNVTFTGCTFKRSHDRYGLWAYGNATITVDACTFDDLRGIKMYSEDHENKENTPSLTVKNTTFNYENVKPAIVLAYGQSVTLEGNTYDEGNAMLELDLGGNPNGTPVISDVTPVCVNDNGACGVLVDGKIYTTVAQAAAVATNSSTVTLLHNSAETVVLPMGATLNKGDFTADNVTVAAPVAKIGEKKYVSLAAAVEDAQAGDEIVVIADIADVTVDVTKNLTISGAATLNNVAINANGADALTVKGLTFTGNSWINSGTAEALTVSGVTATVAPINTAYTNSRSAFISLGRSEGQELALTLVDNNITVTSSGPDAVLGWAKITGATITGNVIKGSSNGYFTNADAIKFMSIANGAEFVIENNEIYSNYNGIVFAQNTTRDNAYSVSVDGNKFLGGADHIWIEITGGNTVHATVNATSTNTVNDNAFTVNDIKYHNGVIKTWSSYAGVDVVTNENGKVVGGTLASFSNAESVAEGYGIGEDGVVVEKAAATINGVKYATLGEAVNALKDGETLIITSDITAGANEFIELNGKKNVTIAAAEGVVINGNISVGYHASHTDNNVDRSASTFTVDNLTVKGTLTVLSNDAELVVKNNKAAQITVKTYKEGMDIALNNNTADGSMGAAANSYGMFIVPNATGYDLTVDGNTFKNVNSHAFVVQGCGDGSAVTAANSIVVANNNFESWGTGGKDDRAAFKIWADTKYAPAESDLAGTTNAMRELVDAIAAAGNTFSSAAENTVQFDAYGAAGDAEEFPAPMYAVATVNGVEYADLQEAINAANGGTVTLVDDITYTTVYANNKTHWNGDLNYELSVGGNVTLDLNGHTIKSTGGSSHSYYALICVRSGSLTVVDSSEAKTGAIICSAETVAQKAYTIYNNGALTLNGGTVSNTVGNYAIESVTVKETALTINEGATVTSTGIAVRVCSQGSAGTQTVVINGGELNGTYAMWVPVKNGGNDIIDMTINGGTFTGSSNAILFNTYTNGDFTTDKIAIAGGTFNGNVLIGADYDADDANHVALSAALAGKVISGGTFSNDVSEYVSKGYALEEGANGTFGVVEVPVAKIGEQGYATLQAAIDAAILMTGDVTIEIMSGTYAQDINLTNAAVTAGDANARPNITFKPAAGADVTFAGTTTLGYRQQNVGASMWNGEVTFEGITFDHAENSKHSLDIQDVKGITLLNCTVTGDGDYGIGSNGSNATPKAAFTNCTFENGAMQVLGQLSANLVIDNSTFNNFSINAQGGTTPGLTIKNSIFNMTLTDAHVGQSFYVVRSNANPINIQNTKVNVDSEVSSVTADQAKWGLFWARQDANAKWAVDGCEVNLTEAAMAQTELLFTKNGATTYDKAKERIVITNLTSASNNVADLVKRAEGCATVNGVNYKNGERDLTGMVAKVGDAYYATLQAAIEAVQEGETITLVDDVDVTTPAYGQNALNHAKAVSFTLDLNDKTLSANTGNSVFRFNIANSGATSDVTLTIKNGTIVAGSNTWCAVMASGISADVKAIMNLENLTIESSKAGDLAVKAWGNATINAKNVTVNATNGAGGFYALGGEIVLDNCTVNQKGLHTAPYLSMAFAVSTNGKMTVNSGTYSAEPAAAAEGSNQGSTHGSWVGGVMNSGGELIINGGTFSNGNFGDDALATAARGLIFADSNGKVTVNGGTFNALKSIFDFQNNLGTTSPVITVKGGSYSADPTKVTSYGSIVLDANYVAVENNGVWTIVEAVAKIGEKAYATLAEAVAAVKEGETITILAGTISEGSIKLPAALKNVTIKGEEGAILKDMTITAADGNTVNYEGLTFDGITFDNSNVVLTGWRTGGVVYKNIKVNGCTFKNIVRTNNEAAFHINCDAAEAVNGFTFTNNVVDGVSGASNSAIYAQVTGEVVVSGNVINNVAFRPYVIQVTTNDGVADKFTVTGNTFSGSAAGRAQGLGSDAAGTDAVELVVSNNIFKDITNAQQICYWNFNAETTTADLSGNYYDIDILANPSRIYFNSAAADTDDLVAMGIFPIYKELNEDGTINENSAYYPPVAKIGDVGYASLEAAVAAAQAGETVVVIKDVEVASGTTITLDGVNLSTLDGVTLTNNGTIEVKGEVSLNIATLAGSSIDFLDGAIVKNSAIGGSVFVAGNVTFRGANTFAMLYDYGTLTDYYGTTAPMKWTVEEGASVTLTNAARYGLGYGDDVTVYGNIEDALTARENLTDADRSLFMHGLVAQESKGWNCDSKFTVENAYVAIGSNNSFGNKSGNYGGTYTFNIKNSVVDASRITFYEALSTTTFTFDGCDVKMGTFMTRDADSKFTLKNSKVLSTTATNGNDEGNYNKGELTLENSTLTYSAEFKHEAGVINLDCKSVLTAPSISGAGKITVDATGLEGSVTVINGDMVNFAGTIEIVGNEYASYSITDEGLVINSSFVAELEIIDGVYGDYTFPVEKTVGKLTYVRTLPAAGIWYPVFLPFDVPVASLADNFDVARINDLHTNFSEEDGSIEKMWVEYIVRKSGTLPAGKPFLVRAKSSDTLDMEISLENVTLYPASHKSTITVASAITEVTFEGVYESLDAPVSTPSTRYMAVNADGVWDEFDGYSLNPFRVMMTLEILDEEYYIASTASLSVGARVIGEENEDGTTTIYDVEADREENDMIFDLQGRRVLETEKGGIYIKNGKKFIVK